ncbi:MAG: AAA family ATPase [Mycobacterium sp.]|nr:AAA family ATPase [Mycobacterium sp.]
MAWLYGRQTECTALDGLLCRVRGGRGAVLVLHGEAAIGKTAMVRYVTDNKSTRARRLSTAARVTARPDP